MKKVLLMMSLLGVVAFAEGAKTLEESPIFMRWSIRRYLPQEVEDDKIDRIIRAGMQAPSAWNQRGREFIVVKDKETLKKLSKLGKTSQPVLTAGAAIVVVGAPEGVKAPEHVDQDLALASQNILIQAVEEGLGGIFLSVAPHEEQMNYVEELLGIPEGKYAFTVIPIGYSKEENKFIDRYEAHKVHYENYKNQ